MKILSGLTALALLVHGTAAAQTRRSRPSAAPAPIGILIGWVSRDGLRPSEPDSAATTTDSAFSGLTATREVTLADGHKVVHVNQTERADPLFSVWIVVSGGKVTTRLLHHIVVPRKDGFWLLGTNTDSADLEGSSAEEDFFWAAPFGQRPAFNAVDSDGVMCSTATTTRDLTYVGPEYLGYAEFREAICAHYGESHGLSVESLDAVRAANLKGLSPDVADVAVLGPRAAAEQRRLVRAATRWPNDCGDAGYAGLTTDWTIRRRPGRWEAVAIFSGSGAGICGRYSEERVLHAPLPRSVASPETPLPVAWKVIKQAFPDATDATASPDGTLVMVLTPSLAIVTAVDGATLRVLGAPISVSSGRPVMLEWARGSQAIQWDEVLSTIPAFNAAAVSPAP